MSVIDTTSRYSTSSVPAVPAYSGTMRFLGREGPYWRLMIRGAVLLMFTLGIYRFWLYTDMRRYLWANTQIGDDELEYVGTARELLLGFLIAIVFLVPINLALFFPTLFGGGVLAQLSGVLAFVLLGVLGHFAVYRARRYRLSRTIFRGVRFYQTGSAVRYALCAVFWLTLTVCTFGLAYPWGQASLERYKMRNTYYGDLGGHFAGSGTRLFFRGILLWLIVFAPFFAALVFALGSIDWTQLGDVLERGGDNMIGRIESQNPNFGGAVAIVIAGTIWMPIAVGVLYPAFQAMMLRWWTSGLRMGTIVTTSHLRTGQMYALYLRFVGFGILLAAVGAGVGASAYLLYGRFFHEPTDLATISGAAGAIVLYVMFMLAYSTIYQVTVKMRIWRVSFESVELAGLQVLDKVRAGGAAASPFGEGLADALHVGGL